MYIHVVSAYLVQGAVLAIYIVHMYMYHSSLSRSAVHVMSTVLRKEEKGRREGGREGGLDNGRLGWREGASEGAI